MSTEHRPPEIGDDPVESHSSHTSHPLLPRRGDYRTLITYQKTEAIYDITFHFCQRFMKPSDRTVDQMVQAARSGKQSIVEGSKAGTTSKETEIRLTNVARASLEELLQDYIDFLRVREFQLWEKESREARYVRKMGMKSPLVYDDFREIVDTRSADTVANIAVCLIHQTNYLLDRQLAGLERTFLREGGLRERMTRGRLKARTSQKTNRAQGAE